MFSQFPILVAPIDHITTVAQTLRGTLTATENSKIITTTGNFVVESHVGAKILTEIDGVTEIVGYIGDIIDKNTAVLEEVSPFTLNAVTATIHSYKSGFVRGANNYLYPKKAQPILIADIFRRVKVTENFVRDTSVMLPYEIAESEMPEHVSQKFYGTPMYHWVILLANNIFDVRDEWPISEQQLLLRVYDQYSVSCAGSATISQNSATIAGTGTSWNTELSPLNQVLLTEKYKILGIVEAVASNTQATLTDVAPFSYTGKILRCNLQQIQEYRNSTTGYVEDYDAEKFAQNEQVALTILDYEIEKNEKKRSIKIVRPDFLNDFTRLFYSALSGAI